MNIVIAGASGFVGSYLSTRLLESGHRITGLGTSLNHPFEGREGFRWIAADTTKKGDWQETLHDADVIINLTGRTIFKYWTKKYKSEIHDSRILTTRHLVEAMGNRKDLLLLSTSAIGYYGHRGDDLLDETQGPGDDFLAGIAVDWEKEALTAEEKGVRVALMRFGVVLGRNGGALSKMVPAFNFFAGGPLGSGHQWFPWIHMEDLVNAVYFIMENSAVKGAVNFNAPGVIRQKYFAKALGKTLVRPAVVPAPAVFMRLLMGEMGNTLLSSQRAVPEKLLSAGFNFNFPDVDAALWDLVH